MTRINIVEPNELSDQHLMAEYREIFMVGSALQRSIRSKNFTKNSTKYPKKFTLNSGHVSFFYDKGKYLNNRYESIKKELKSRGFNLDKERIFKRHQWPDDRYNDWQPTSKDQDIARERINLRLSEKKGWYRYRGRIIK